VYDRYVVRLTHLLPIEEREEVVCPPNTGESTQGENPERHTDVLHGDDAGVEGYKLCDKDIDASSVSCEEMAP